MNILFLGPPCPRLEHYLSAQGHSTHREEIPLPPHFLENHSFDFCISYRYRHILLPEQIRSFHGRIINLHLSLLPWNRGSDPNLWSFLENTPKGVTIHQLGDGLNTGNILLQREMAFTSGRETLRTAYAALSDALEQLFLDNCEALLSEAISPHPQLGEGSCHFLRDKISYLHLIEEKWWDTQVDSLIDAAHEGNRPKKKTRERERERERELRPVLPSDREFLFHLANDPGVRAMSFHSALIPWERHCAWFASRLTEGYPFYIVLYKGIHAGYIRFEEESNTREELALALALSPGFRGKGLGTYMIRAATHRILAETSIRRVGARVRQHNQPSLRAFARNHFSRAGTDIQHGMPFVHFIYPGYEE